MRRELTDLELTSPARAPTPAAAGVLRTTVRLQGTPIGVVETVGAESPLARALARYGRRLHAELVVPHPDHTVTPPTITAVVCTRDRPDTLEGCLDALARLRYPAFDVLVVDNDPSDDRTRAVALRAGARYVREPCPGLDRARNRALAEASGSVVAYVDDDARPEAGWLAAIARGLASPEVGAVAGLVLPAELETDAQLLFEDVYGGMGKGFDLRLVSGRTRPTPLRPETVGTGCNMAFRREVLLSLGGFDPALDVGTATGGGGDLDAFQRVREGGWTIAYRPDAVVRHLHRRSEDALARQLFDNGRGYSAALFAALLRAPGGDRGRVVARYGHWLASWHGRRILRRLAGRERLPLRFLLAELRGAPLGPFLYLKARRDARATTRGDRRA